MSRQTGALRAKRKEASSEEIALTISRALLEGLAAAEYRKHEAPSESRLKMWDVLPDWLKSRETSRAPHARLEDTVEMLCRRTDAIEEKADLALAEVREVRQAISPTPSTETLRETLQTLLSRLRTRSSLANARVYLLRADYADRGNGPAGIVVIGDSPDYVEKGLVFFGLIDALAREGHDVDDILLFRTCEINEEQLNTEYEEVT